MWESIMRFIRKVAKKENQTLNSKDAAKERLHLVLMQDRANVSADFLELMKQEIIEVIKKYIDVDESAIDVRLTNKDNGDGTKGAPALYANIPIVNIKDEVRQNAKTNTETTVIDNTDVQNAEESNKEKNEQEEQEKPKEKIIESKIEEKNKEIEEVIHENQDEQNEKNTDTENAES